MRKDVLNKMVEDKSIENKNHKKLIKGKIRELLQKIEEMRELDRLYKKVIEKE